MPSHQHHEHPGITIRAMRHQDADEVLAIYQQGLDTGHASFETTAPTWQAFDTAKLAQYRYVATDTAANPANTVLGWIAATPVSDRCCYAGVVEHSCASPEIVETEPGRRLCRWIPRDARSIRSSGRERCVSCRRPAGR